MFLGVAKEDPEEGIAIHQLQNYQIPQQTQASFPNAILYMALEVLWLL